jgi:hypothetical protein
MGTPGVYRPHDLVQLASAYHDVCRRLDAAMPVGWLVRETVAISIFAEAAAGRRGAAHLRYHAMRGAKMLATVRDVAAETSTSEKTVRESRNRNCQRPEAKPSARECPLTYQVFQERLRPRLHCRTKASPRPPGGGLVPIAASDREPCLLRGSLRLTRLRPSLAQRGRLQSATKKPLHVCRDPLQGWTDAFRITRRLHVGL